MSSNTKNRIYIGAVVIVFGFLAACEPSESLKEEAYEAGWTSAWREICKGIEPPLMMPDKYDDSKGSGELVSYFRSGIFDAKNDNELCE